MGYYQGDYYRGTAGDPFLGGLFGKIFSVGKSLLGFGGGTSTKAIQSAVQTGIERVISRPGIGQEIVKVGKAGIQKGVGLVKQHPVLTAAGASGIIGAAGAATLMHPAARAGMMRGFHVSKKSGRLVRNRRMNACNSRALHRALRRAHAFERLARRVIGFSSPRRPKGHMYFKRKKGRK